MAKTKVQAFAARDPRMEEFPSIQNSTETQWRGRLQDRQLGMDFDELRSWKCLVFRQYPRDPVAYARGKTSGRTVRSQNRASTGGQSNSGIQDSSVVEGDSVVEGAVDNQAASNNQDAADDHVASNN